MLFHGVEQQMMQYEAYRAHKSLIVYVPPFMLVIGSIGNLLSFIIMARKGMRKLSTYNYLAVLAITDTLVLYVGLLRIWVAEIAGRDMRDHAVWICKTINVLGYTVSDYSVWLIIAMTVERWIAVCMPLKAPSMCNRRKAGAAIVCIFVLLLSLNLHFFWTTGIIQKEYAGELYRQCDSYESYETLTQEVWPWVDAFIYSFVPFVILLTLNAHIIHRVLLSKRQRLRMGAAQTGNGDARTQRNGHSEHSRKLTVMLLTISFTFLLTTLPMNILLIVKAFSSLEEVGHDVVAKFMLARTVTELLMYSNHSMNFFLYCATGEKFRQQLCLMFCCHQRRKSRANGYWLSEAHGHTERTTLTPSPRNALNHNRAVKEEKVDLSPADGSAFYQESSLIVPENTQLRPIQSPTPLSSRVTLSATPVPCAADL